MLLILGTIFSILKLSSGSTWDLAQVYINYTKYPAGYKTVYLDANLTPKDLGRMSSRSCKLNLSQLISWDSPRPPFKTTLKIKSVNVISQVFDIILIKGKINIWGYIEVNWVRKSDFDKISTEIIFLNGQLCISHFNRV